MTTIMELIEDIRKRPGLMLGRPSVNNLYTFLSGFCFARKDAGVSDYEFLAGFGRHVHRRFKISSTQSWAAIIEFFGATEDGEMALFWKLYDDYLAKSATKRKKVS